MTVSSKSAMADAEDDAAQQLAAGSLGVQDVPDAVSRDNALDPHFAEVRVYLDFGENRAERVHGVFVFFRARRGVGLDFNIGQLLAGDQISVSLAFGGVSFGRHAAIRNIYGIGREAEQR